MNDKDPAWYNTALDLYFDANANSSLSVSGILSPQRVLMKLPQLRFLAMITAHMESSKPKLKLEVPGTLQKMNPAEPVILLYLLIMTGTTLQINGKLITM